VTSLQEERDLALAAYRSACVEFDEAQQEWDSHLAATGVIEADPMPSAAAFDRLKAAYQAKQDALDSLWLAWRNRPDLA
jgi:hypothetical protein